MICADNFAMSVLEPEIQNIKGLAMYENKKRVGGLGRMRILMPRPAVADSTVVARVWALLAGQPSLLSSLTRLEYICSIGRSIGRFIARTKA